MNYDAVISAAKAVTHKQGKVKCLRGDLHFGSGQVRVPTMPGLIVTGHLKSVKWSDWKTFFDSLSDEKTNDKKSRGR